MASNISAVVEANRFYREGLAHGVVTTLDVIEEGIHDGLIPRSAELVLWLRNARMNLGEHF